MNCEVRPLNISYRISSHVERVLFALTHFPLDKPISLQQIAEEASAANLKIRANEVFGVVNDKADCAVVEGTTLTRLADPRNYEISIETTELPSTCRSCYYAVYQRTTDCPILADVIFQRFKARGLSHPDA